PRRHADDREVTGASKARNSCHRAVREVIAGRGERDADRIEDQMFGARGHRRRDCRRSIRADKARGFFRNERGGNGFKLRRLEDGHWRVHAVLPDRVSMVAVSLRMIFSENRFPPPGSSPGQAFSGSCSSCPDKLAPGPWGVSMARIVSLARAAAKW